MFARLYPYAGKVQSPFVLAPFDQPRQDPTGCLSPLHELIGGLLKLPPISLHPQPTALQIAEAHVETEGNQSVEDALAISRSRAKSGHAALKPAKVLSKDSVHLSHGDDPVPARGYR